MDKEQIKEDFLTGTGELIHKKRKKKNMSQKELGDFLGVTKSTISKYETGKTDIPASNLYLISKKCGFSVHEYAEKWDALDKKDVIESVITAYKEASEPKIDCRVDYVVIDKQDSFENREEHERNIEYLAEFISDNDKKLLEYSLCYIEYLEKRNKQKYLGKIFDYISDKENSNIKYKMRGIINYLIEE